MYFKRDRDCWEYGYVTVHIWKDTTFIRPLKEKDKEAFNYFKITNKAELLNNFNSGEVTFSYEQSLFFSGPPISFKNYY